MGLRTASKLCVFLCTPASSTARDASPGWTRLFLAHLAWRLSQRVAQYGTHVPCRGPEKLGTLLGRGAGSGWELMCRNIDNLPRESPVNGTVNLLHFSEAGCGFSPSGVHGPWRTKKTSQWGSRTTWLRRVVAGPVHASVFWALSHIQKLPHFWRGPWQEFSPSSTMHTLSSAIPCWKIYVHPPDVPAPHPGSSTLPHPQSLLQHPVTHPHIATTPSAPAPCPTPTPASLWRLHDDTT